MTPTSETVDVAFTPDRMDRFKRLVALYEQPASALLPTLYIAQEQFGWLSQPVLGYVAKLLSLTERHVTEAASFYTMFKKRDLGKVCLQVCQNITCTMMGSEELLQVIREELNIGPGDVTEDKAVSCMTVECLGSCDTAPVVQVNEDYVEKLTPERLRELLKKLKAGDAGPLLAAQNK